MKLWRASSVLFFLFVLVVWACLSQWQLFRSDLFPYLGDFFSALREEIASGRLVSDVVASLYRWSCGFILAVLTGTPFGLLLGKQRGLRMFFMPYLNMLRSLSPLAWIPFTVIWFGIGDLPVVFLVFLGCMFPILFSTMQAVSLVPKVYDQLALDYEFRGMEYAGKILFPAVFPQVVGSLRLVAGLGWIVIVPAEMLAGKEGLGFAILDARNGMRTDLLLVNMVAIALLANAIDHALRLLNKKSEARWGRER